MALPDWLRGCNSVDGLVNRLAARRTAALRTGDWCHALGYDDPALARYIDAWAADHNVAVDVSALVRRVDEG